MRECSTATRVRRLGAAALVAGLALRCFSAERPGGQRVETFLAATRSEAASHFPGQEPDRWHYCKSSESNSFWLFSATRHALAHGKALSVDVYSAETHHTEPSLEILAFPTGRTLGVFDQPSAASSGITPWWHRLQTRVSPKNLYCLKVADVSEYYLKYSVRRESVGPDLVPPGPPGRELPSLRRQIAALERDLELSRVPRSRWPGALPQTIAEAEARLRTLERVRGEEALRALARALRLYAESLDPKFADRYVRVANAWRTELALSPPLFAGGDRGEGPTPPRLSMLTQLEITSRASVGLTRAMSGFLGKLDSRFVKTRILLDITGNCQTLQQRGELCRLLELVRARAQVDDLWAEANRIVEDLESAGVPAPTVPLLSSREDWSLVILNLKRKQAELVGRIMQKARQISKEDLPVEDEPKTVKEALAWFGRASATADEQSAEIDRYRTLARRAGHLRDQLGQRSTSVAPWWYVADSLAEATQALKSDVATLDQAYAAQCRHHEERARRLQADCSELRLPDRPAASLAEARNWHRQALRRVREEVGALAREAARLLEAIDPRQLDEQGRARYANARSINVGGAFSVDEARRRLKEVRRLCAALR